MLDAQMVHEVTTEDAANLRATIAWLDRYYQEAPTFMQRCYVNPQSGSTAATELQSQTGRTAYSTGMAYLVSGLDYLQTLFEVFRSSFVPNFAGYALARGCLEAGGIAAWIFEPSLSTRERMVRGLLARIDSLRNQHKVNENDEHLSRRLRQVETSAAQHNIAVVKKGREYYVDNERHPSTTNLLDKVLQQMKGRSDSQRSFYARLCGFTHSTTYAIVGSAQLGQTEEGGWTSGRTNVNVSALTGCVLTSARVHAFALQRLGQLAGLTEAPALPQDGTT
jgi:hypothetical protein